MPRLTELRVFDNSEERDVETGKFPPPRLLLHWDRGAVVAPALESLESTPEWAKPIVAFGAATRVAPGATAAWLSSDEDRRLLDGPSTDICPALNIDADYRGRGLK